MRQATFMTDWRRSASADSRRATSGATAHTSAHIPDGALERIPYRQNQQWGLIDLHGRVITPPRFRLRNDLEGILSPLFRRGVAVVYLAENWPREQEVLIDRDGCVLARRSSFFNDDFELLSLTPDQP